MVSPTNRDNEGATDLDLADVAQDRYQSKLPWCALRAGLLYFVIVFSVGCALGFVRILLVEPQFGTRLAELLEMPLMLMTIVFTAHWVVQRLAVPPLLWSRLGMGLTALVCLLCAEWGIILPLRGLSMADYIATRDPVSGTVYQIMLCLLAVMPWLMSPDKSLLDERKTGL